MLSSGDTYLRDLRLVRATAAPGKPQANKYIHTSGATLFKSEPGKPQRQSAWTAHLMPNRRADVLVFADILRKALCLHMLAGSVGKTQWTRYMRVVGQQCWASARKRPTRAERTLSCKGGTPCVILFCEAVLTHSLAKHVARSSHLWKIQMSQRFIQRQRHLLKQAQLCQKIIRVPALHIPKRNCPASWLVFITDLS